PALFPGQAILESAAFRIARDAELDLDDEGGRGFLEVIEEELRNRRRSQVVRLEVDARSSAELTGLLAQRLGVTADDVYRIDGPLDLRGLAPLLELPALEDLRDPPLKPLALLDLAARESLFDLLGERDVLLHHPYESF